MAKYSRYILNGVVIGLLVALAALASGDSPNPSVARFFDIVEKPVSIISGNNIALWLLLHFAFWMMIGGLLGWGIAVLKSKLLGEV
jgi:hypothetical protein